MDVVTLAVIGLVTLMNDGPGQQIYPRILRTYTVLHLIVITDFLSIFAMLKGKYTYFKVNLNQTNF